MSTGFIEYKDKGFLTSDIFIQLVLHYVSEELNKDQYTFTDKE